MISYIVVNSVTNVVSVWGRGEFITSNNNLPHMETLFRNKFGDSTVIYTANTFASGLEESINSIFTDGQLISNGTAISNAVFTIL